MLFPHFDGMFSRLKRQSRESGRKQNLFKEVASWIDTHYRMMSAHQLSLAFAEMVHYGLSHNVLHVRLSIAEALLRQRMSFRLGDLKVPFQLFEVCPERMPGSTESSISIPSFIVVFKSAPYKKLLENLGDHLREMEMSDVAALAASHDQGFTVYSHNPLDLQSRIVMHMAPEQVEGESIERVLENLPTIKDGVLSPDERSVETRVLRLALALISYLNTSTPDLLGATNQHRPKLGLVDPKIFVVGDNFQNNPPNWHLRSAHWRCLRHRRFNRSSDGTARVVWVKSSQVSKLRSPALPRKKTHLIDVPE